MCLKYCLDHIRDDWDSDECTFCTFAEVEFLVNIRFKGIIHDCLWSFYYRTTFSVEYFLLKWSHTREKCISVNLAKTQQLIPVVTTKVKGNVFTCRKLCLFCSLFSPSSHSGLFFHAYCWSHKTWTSSVTNFVSSANPV